MRLTLLFVLLAACTNSTGAKSNPDAAGSGSGSGSACTGVVYDPCTDNTQCMSGMCHAYGQSALTVCTQACTAGDSTTCPLDSTGAHGTCNNMGNCKPAKANACTR